MHSTGFIVHVPEAEPRVDALRARFHPVARLGVPAHVTILFPFMAPERVDASVLQRVRDALAGFAAFAFTLEKVGRFPATTYLAPEPAAHFIDLTKRLAAAFPEFPPFGGEFDTIIPHLTVAHGVASEADVAQTELTAAMASGGPIQSSCDAVILIENSTGCWKPMHTFALARATCHSTPS